MADRAIDRAYVEALERENRRLQRGVEELSVLNNLAREIGALHEPEAIMTRMVRQALRAIAAEQGVITLVDEQVDTDGRTLVRTAASSNVHQPFRLNQSVLGWMYLHRKPLLVNRPGRDDRFSGVPWDSAIRSLLCVPLMVKSRLIGLLTLYNKRGTDGFSVDDQRLLSILASQSAQVIENARLYEEEKALLRMQSELHLAREIQMNLLPQQAPSVRGYELAGISEPAQLVGGDYLDFIDLGAACTACCVGDVSGKGLPASLLMANVQATLRTLLHDQGTHRSVADSLARANRLLRESTSRRTFVTLFCGILDAERHRFRYANAGHNRPLLITANAAPRRLETAGLALSFLPAATYEEAVMDLQPGDLLLIYSDGVSEAMNEAREQFGEERLAALMHTHHQASARALVERILGAVKAHAGAEPLADDITLLAIRRLPESTSSSP